MADPILRLARAPGVGPGMGWRLLARYPDPAALFRESEADLAEVVGPAAARALRDPGVERAAEEEARRGSDAGFRMLAAGRPGYPDLLTWIADPPLVLWVRGEILPADALAIAVVGTRRPTVYGRRQAARFARELGRIGVCVVSGLARGIDGVAHAAALDAGGRTIAVLGSGLLRVYPPEHRALAARVARSGAVVSELPLTAPPLSHNFPRRNRILSGLSLGVLVVEAGLRSGALATANLAGGQGREVFAVPGRIDEPTAQGTNRLIRDGAKLATDLASVLGEFGDAWPSFRQLIAEAGAGVEAAEGPCLSAEALAVLRRLPEQPTPAEEALAAAGLAAERMAQVLVELEAAGAIEVDPAGRIVPRLHRGGPAVQSYPFPRPGDL
ncbi:MAG: DNA-processing protein DprA [Planctomycetes bacterium]|nr:DNA-processing protein DprA [Planctomycetota bacterium]